MTIILRRPWTRQPSFVEAELKYRNAFVFSQGARQPASFVDAAVTPYTNGLSCVISSGVIAARADYQLVAAPPITGSLAWTLIALQFWPTNPSNTGIIGLRDGTGPTFCTFSGVYQFYTTTTFISSTITATAGLHCVALSHNGNGSGSYVVDGVRAAVTGLGSTASPSSVVTLMNWDPTTGSNFSPGIGAACLFAAIITETVPTEELVQITREKAVWRLFKPRRIIIPVGAAAPTTFIPSWARQNSRVIGGGV